MAVLLNKENNQTHLDISRFFLSSPMSGTLTNPQLLLLNTLNHAYNDNRALAEQLMTTVRTSQHQIEQMLSTVRRLHESNDAIMATVTHMLNPPPSTTTTNAHPILSNVPIRTTFQTTTSSVPRGQSAMDMFFSLLRSVRTIDDSDNQPRGATLEEIEHATRSVLFSDIVRPLNTQCPITMNDFQDSDPVTMVRHCGHIFQRDALATWFQRNHCCPVCRYDISTHEE